MKILAYPSAEAEAKLQQISDRSLSCSEDQEQAVAAIIRAVRSEGDAALLRYCHQFDAPELTVEQIRVSPTEMAKAAAEVEDDFRATLERARHNISRFHQAQRQQSWLLPRGDGSLVGQIVRPVAAAGLYIPGGQRGETPLISSLLMNAIPALVAGVPRLQIATPPRPDGSINPYLLAAAGLLGIDKIFKLGSAWAIAAFAYGTESVPAVDVIVGPGNIYVALAKKLVAGQVGIDLIAGPSEILVIADSSAPPLYLAADLLSQAEHDPLASAVLLTTSEELARRTSSALQEQLALLPRRQIAEAALAAYGAIMVVADLDTAIGLANRLAPEHLELLVAEPLQWLGKLHNAGAVFLGAHSPEAVGDYFAGPNHVLPTAGTARFTSGLSVEHFVKKTNVISYSAESLQRDAADIIRLAELEGLQAHARSVQVRLEKMS